MAALPGTVMIAVELGRRRFRLLVIVTAPVADARAAPGEQAPLVFQAQQGVVLDIAEPPAGGWVKVRHAGGQTGYVKISQVWGT